jgi:hypothetical protein
MKKSFFNAFAKAAMIASVSLALVNCDDSTAPTTPGLEVGEEQGPQEEGSGEELGPEQGQGDLGGGLVESSESNETNESNGLGNSSASESFEGPVESFSSSSEEQTVESSSSEVVEEGGIFLANDTDEDKDYMEIEYVQGTGWDGGGILAYPKRLSTTKKHAVVVWAPGGGTEPGAYGGMIKRLASHGFVVIALKESPGYGTQATKALDWMGEQNNNPQSPLFGKLDLTKVGCSGHSMGGLESEWMVAHDDRVVTAMLNNSGYMGGWNPDLTPMTIVPTNKTIGIVYGEGGMERPNAEGDYNNPNVKAPACLIKMTGGQGTECQQGECGYGHGSGAWNGVAATVAWMRWHLGGEDWRKADFVGTTGKYIDGPIYTYDWQGNQGTQGHWKGQCKNFN